MKSKFKISIIIVLLIILLISICLLLYNNKQQDINQNVNNIEPGSGKIEATYKLKKTESIPSYIIVNNCANRYFEYIREKNIEALNTILISDYQNNNQSINKIDFLSQFNAKIIYEYNANISIKTFFVKGILINKENNTVNEILLIINVDYINNTFEISPLEGTYSQYIKASNFENIEVSQDIEKEIKSIK